VKIGQFKAGGERKITAKQMICMRKTAAHNWTGCKTNTELAQEINLTSVLNKI
jgi:hypothetical protein